MGKGIIGYNELEGRADAVVECVKEISAGDKTKYLKGCLECLAIGYVEVCESGMKLQDRNEKLRKQNARLVEIINSVREAVQ